MNFAVNLKIADMYERAQEVIDNILAEVPGHEDVLELSARTTLTRAYEGLEQWASLIETATESLALFDEQLDRIDAITSRCLAYWKLGREEESDEDLKTLQSSPRAAWRAKMILRIRDQANHQA